MKEHIDLLKRVISDERATISSHEVAVIQALALCRIAEELRLKRESEDIHVTSSVFPFSNSQSDQLGRPLSEILPESDDLDEGA